MAKLRQHAYIDDRNATHVFQYLILPSFRPPIAWDVFRRPRKDSEHDHVLLRSSWRSDLDEEKLRTPVERLRHPYPLVPSIVVHQLSVPSEDLKSLAIDLAGLEIRIGASPPIGGVDGVFYEVALEQPPHFIALAAKCRLSWWCDLPTEWRQLAAWAKRAEGVFESAWSTHGEAGAVPLPIRAIDDAAARHEAQRLFHAGNYGRAGEVLADVASREKLTPVEVKMLEMALKRMGGPEGGGRTGG